MIFISILILIAIIKLFSKRKRDNEYVSVPEKIRDKVYETVSEEETRELIRNLRLNHILKSKYSIVERPEIEIPNGDINNSFNQFFISKHLDNGNSIIQINELLRLVIIDKVFLSFKYNDRIAFVKPEVVNSNQLKAHCYIENLDYKFSVNEISDPIVKEKLFIIDAKVKDIGTKNLLKIIKYGIEKNKFIRILYHKPGWYSYRTDYESGETIDNSSFPEESLRTIKDINFSIYTLKEDQLIRYNLDNNYISGYCFKRKAQRTFKIDRIKEIAILDL